MAGPTVVRTQAKATWCFFAYVYPVFKTARILTSRKLFNSMAHRIHGLEVVLQKCESIVKDMGLNIVYTHNLDPFFKGDLDGKSIFIGYHLSPSEKLFNLVHLAGHSIQWNTDDLLRTMGSELYINPSDELLRK